MANDIYTLKSYNTYAYNVCMLAMCAYLCDSLICYCSYIATIYSVIVTVAS